MQTLDTDILILGAGGAGLFAALHAKKARPELDVTIAVKGLLGKVRLHPHGAGRLQRRAARRGFGRAAFHGHDRGRRLAQPAGAGVAPGQHRARFASANWKTRSAASSTAIPTAPCIRRRSPGRPSTAPCTRAISPASRSSIGWPSRSGARDVRRLEDHRALDLIPAADGSRPCRRLHARHADRRAADGARAGDACSRPAAGRPCTSITRRPATSPATAWRWRSAPACRFATWRWCSSIRPDCWRAPARG